MIYKVSATVEALQEGKLFDEVFRDGEVILFRAIKAGATIPAISRRYATPATP